jgi:hypothetical protein
MVPAADLGEEFDMRSWRLSRTVPEANRDRRGMEFGRLDADDA